MIDDTMRDDLVRYVRRNYVEYNRELWEDPAREAAYYFEVVLPESMRSDFLMQLIAESSES